jgi:CRP-like cAMP-binding protein
MALHDSPITLPASERVAVLEYDAGLAEAVAEARRPRATAASGAAVLRAAPGAWRPSDAAEAARGGFGLLVLGGVLVRRVGIGERYGAELLAAGDLLRPWQHDGYAGVMPFEMTWQVVGDARLAVLDLRWAAHMAPYPEVAAELAGRATARALRLAMLIAIAQHPRLEERMWLLFWELADRFGTVGPDGVHLDLPLTHELLAHLAAARRPSVSSALGRLAERGIVRRTRAGWLITGPPPARARTPPPPGPR